MIVAFLLVFILWSGSVQAGEHILQCMEPVHLADPNFVQGSELFFDFYLEEQGISVQLTRGDLQTEALFFAKDSERFNLDERDRSLSVQWSSSPRLVVRQFETRWYGEFWFPEKFSSKLLNLEPGSSITISCIEKGRLLLDVD